jgi:hypothetical protein
MQAFYLYANAALYLLFAVWCTVKSSGTADSLGYRTLSAGGRSEYLVIYGGLQLGLALIFWQCAMRPSWRQAGVLATVLLYAPIVLYRLITIARFWPVGGLTVATGVLECTLLAWGLWILSAVD